jgi:lysophospholipase L1-like esterase
VRRRPLYALVALALSLSLAACGGEAALRILGWGPPYFAFDPQIGYVIRPNASFQVSARDEGGARQLTSNSHGLRDVEHAYEKPAGVRRILVLGDSFCEAQQVNLEDAFFRVLQQRLDATGAVPKTELINAGVSGYGTDRELLFYRHEARKYSPDDVLLLFVFNDVRNNDRAMQLQMYGDRNEPYFVLNGSELELRNFPARQSAWAGARQVVRQHVYLYHFVWDLVQEARLSRRAVEPGSGVPFDYRLYEDPVDPAWDRAWTITAALLRELQIETARDGARLIVAAVTNDLQLHSDHREQMFDQYPTMRDMRWDWAQTHRRLGEICAANGIAFLDLLPPFLAAAEREPTTYLHTFGGHWTKAGHRLVADVLADALRQP